ncbi:DUF6463 family protein [Microbacterium sp.]|uniref:DUF6463 family protein n=1 Tax=Microbacterium sp. TaxID=51671 RepID=UPI0028123314|nr:DUF6463 family protein [Microbacterium sp.]
MEQHSATENIPLRVRVTAATAHPARRADRLTVAAAVTLLLISVLHTAVFVAHGWWDSWLAGPLRSEQMPIDAFVHFWALPGGFVVPIALLALLILEAGRRGATVPAYVGFALAAWAVVCVWIVGPSGFLLFAVPALLLIMAGSRARRRQSV